MLQGFVTERKLLKASARLGVGRTHHDTRRSLGRRWERWTLRKMRLNKADGKKEVHVICLSSGLPQHLVPFRTSLATCVSRTGAVWLHLSPSLTLERPRLCITHVFSEPNMGLSHGRSTPIFECVDQSIDVKLEIIIPVSVEPNLGRHWLNTSRVSPFLVFRSVLWHRYHYLCCLTGGRNSYPYVSDSRVFLLNLEVGCLSEVVGQPFPGLAALHPWPHGMWSLLAPADGPQESRA